MRTGIKKGLMKILSVTAAMAMSAVTVIPAGLSAAAAPETVTISSREEFISFADSCVLDSYSQGKTFVLECDVILSGNITVPVFCGTFEGGGHTISGLRIDGSGSQQGLFRYIEETGVVKDLKVTGSVAPAGSGEDCGGIAGVDRGGGIGCTFSGLVNGKANCGGIAGVNEESGFIADCNAGGAVRSKVSAGGIAGENSGLIICSVNEAAVNTIITEDSFDLESINADDLLSGDQLSDITDSGGIAGVSTGAIQNCVNRGSIGYPHVGYNIGGIAGRQVGYISGCVNYGEINGRKDTGGIVGQAEPYVSLFYDERTADKLRTALDELGDIIDDTADNIRSRSDILAGNTDDILEGLERVHAGADDYIDNADRVINANVDSLNDLSSRITDFADMAKPVSDSLSAASDDLEGAMSDLSEAAGHLANAGESVDEGMDHISAGLSELSKAVGVFSDASDSLNSSLDTLESSLGDEAAMTAAMGDLRKSLGDMRQSLGEILGAVSDLMTALDDYNSDITVMSAKDNIKYELSRFGDISGRLSSDLESCESAMRNIENLLRAEVYDVSSYTPYIEEILNNLSGGAMSDLISSMGSVVNYCSQLISGEAASRLSDSAKQSVDRLTEGIRQASESGENVSNALDEADNARGSGSVTAFWDEFRDSLYFMGDSAEPLQNALDYINDSKEFLEEADREAVEASLCAESAMDKAASASDNAKAAFDGIGDIIDYFADKDKITFTGADDDIIAARDSLSGLMTDLGDLCSILTENADGTVGSLADDITALNSKAGEVSDLLFDLIDEISDKSTDPADYTEDISAEDTAGRSDGKIASCTNYGSVNGDVSAGGIAGAMAVEYDFDPEGDIDTVGDRSLNFMYMSKTVVRECKNYGSVTTKKDHAGGIVGQMDTGCLINCGGYGTVRSSDGSYAGGIAGISEATIYGCYAMCRVGADRYAGGIAGLGRDMEGCRSYVIIEKAAEQAGLVAGYADGDVKDCSFIAGAKEPVTEFPEDSEDGEYPEVTVSGAVDNISYSGKAYPVSYEEMMNTPGVPEEFGQLRITFLTDELPVNVNVTYGGSISEKEMPLPPAKEGSYVRWQEFDRENITFGATVEAIYSDYVTALSGGGENEEGLAVLICQGVFGERDSLAVENEGGIYRVTIPTEADGIERNEHTVRYLAEFTPQRTELILNDGSGERRITPETDGKYLVFTVNGSSFELAVHEKAQTTAVYWSIGGAAVVAAIAVFIVIKKKRSKPGKPKTSPKQKEKVGV